MLETSNNWFATDGKLRERESEKHTGLSPYEVVPGSLLYTMPLNLSQYSFLPSLIQTFPKV